jgi:maltose O-acetyltransferase
LKIRRIIGRLIYVVASRMPSSDSKIQLGQKFIRALCARMILNKCGRHVNIERKARFSSNIEIGDYSGIGVRCEVNGPCRIGKHVMMAPECIIFTQNHRTDRVDIPMTEQGVTPPKEVVIGDDVWIGRRVMIMPGVKIGNHSIIAAGAIVTHDVPDYAIAAGVPARVVKYRNDIGGESHEPTE